MKSVLFAIAFVVTVAAFFATYADAAQPVVVRQPLFRPNATVIRQAPQRAAIVVQPRQQIVVQPRQNFAFAQPQAFILQQPQAFTFGPHVQQFSLPGNCPSALLFGR